MREITNNTNKVKNDDELYLQSFIKLKHIRPLLDVVSPIEVCNHGTSDFIFFKNSKFMDVDYDDYYVWGIGMKEIECEDKDHNIVFKQGIEIRITKVKFNVETRLEEFKQWKPSQKLT